MSLSDKHTIKEIHIDKLTDIKQLFDYYYRPLVLYAEEYLKDREAAEDVVQELFIKLWETKDLFKKCQDQIGAYLYVAVKNNCYTYLQKKKRLCYTDEYDSIDIPVEKVADIDEERLDALMHVVEKLPNRTRLVVEDVMVRNMKYKEVAQELGISVNTVKYLLKEGVKRLRDHFSSFRFTF